MGIRMEEGDGCNHVHTFAISDAGSTVLSFDYGGNQAMKRSILAYKLRQLYTLARAGRAYQLISSNCTEKLTV